jgi:predicted phosphodiesterase
MKHGLRWFCAAVTALAFDAAAREADGTLGLLITPNNGIPALIQSGGTFEAVSRESCLLKTVGDAGAFDVTAKWQDLPGGLKKANCTVPGNVPPGTYTLEGRAGERLDTNTRAVYVYDAFPASYSFAQVTDTHIGAAKDNRPAADIVRGVLAAVNESGAAFALVTGDLTDGGEPEQFRGFLDVLDTCRVPTYVCAGNHDRNGDAYERVFGLTHYAFRFGEDGYLAVDTKDFLVADDLEPQTADLEVDRRAIKAARWSIGFTHRYERDMGMHAQIALFIDNPLDLLLFGHWHRENTDAEKTVPWAGWRHSTRIVVTPAAVDGKMRLFDVTPVAVTPRELQKGQ